MPLDAHGRFDPHIDLAMGKTLFRCQHCGQTVARPDELLPIGGEHEHVVFNPAGMIFRVWCFADAQNLRLLGHASTQFSWFKGYAWTIALCHQCGQHLGWRYDGSAEPTRFYGLIGDRLAEGPAE